MNNSSLNKLNHVQIYFSKEQIYHSTASSREYLSMISFSFYCWFLLNFFSPFYHRNFELFTIHLESFRETNAIKSVQFYVLFEWKKSTPFLPLNSMHSLNTALNLGYSTENQQRKKMTQNKNRTILCDKNQRRIWKQRIWKWRIETKAADENKGSCHWTTQNLMGEKKMMSPIFLGHGESAFGVWHYQIESALAHCQFHLLQMPFTFLV